MTMTTEMKTHDLKPDLTIYAEDAAGLTDLRNVASWRILAKMAGASLFIDTAPTVTVDSVNHSKATMVHQWVTGETANVGSARVEAEATWPDGKTQTFPADGYVVVRFVQDLG